MTIISEPQLNALIVGLVSVSIAGCGGCGSERANEPAPVIPVIASPSATYDVHEWGLVRGTADDRVMLSGPHAEPVAMPMAKPVLYFHRVGQGPLSIDLQVQVPLGRIIEHWPLVPNAEPASITWRGVAIGEGTCPGTRYATASEPPCSLLPPPDACETAELAIVETNDGDCLETSDGSTWNHLFYRGEVDDPPELPLRLVRTPNRVTVTHRGTAPIVGQLIVLKHGQRPEAVLVVEPPEPGRTVEVDWSAASAPEATPTRSAFDDAALALSASLELAGLTDQEAAAFRRAWDAPFFGLSEHAAAGETHAASTISVAAEAEARPVGPPRFSLVYVLPEPVADSLATLRFSPSPRTIRRVIVAWVDGQ